MADRKASRSPAAPPDGTPTPTLTPTPAPARGRRSHRTRAELDAPDRHIIEQLGRDGRRTNRALAAAIGLTEATVASRIRSLADRRILGITAVLDWEVAGYEWDVWLALDVDVGVQSLAQVSAALAALPSVHSVHTVLGPVDLVVHALLADRAEAVAFITEQIGAIPGVRRARPNVVLETFKYAVHYARVPVAAGEPHFPAARVVLDDLDRHIINALQRDGRQSNRGIGRQLNVSEGTVRVRLRRMEDTGLLRIVGQSDPYRAGLVSVWALLWVDVEGGTGPRVARELAAMSEVMIVAVTAGTHDLLVAVAGVSRRRLVELVVEDIRAVPGVRTTETWEVAHTLRLNYQWARLV